MHQIQFPLGQRVAVFKGHTSKERGETEDTKGKGRGGGGYVQPKNFGVAPPYVETDIAIISSNRPISKLFQRTVSTLMMILSVSLR